MPARSSRAEMTKDTAGKNATEADFNPDEIDVYGFTMPVWWGGWLPYILSNGAKFASDDGMHLLLNQPESVEAMQNLQDLIYKYHVMPNPTQTSTLPGGDVLMQSRKVAMAQDGMWRVTDFNDSRMNWGLGVLPMDVQVSVSTADALERYCVKVYSSLGSSAPSTPFRRNE